MNFAITFKNIRSDSETIGYIDHRLAFAFAHAPHRIQEAKITLSDLSDTQGNLGKQCQIILTPSGMPSIIVSERQSTLRQAIDRCLQRASQHLKRTLKRGSTNKTPAHTLPAT